MLDDILLISNLEILLEKYIENTTDEGLFTLYIQRAVTLIKNYLNNDKFTTEYIKNNFQDAICEIIVLAYKSKDKENIKSITQGSRAVTYSDGTHFALSDNVKALLPKPYIKIF